MAFDLKFNTPFLNDYLEMVEETESPRIYHIWCAVSGIASALGRRNFFPFGDGVIYPNQFVLMVGTPGTRKSTAMKLMKKQLKKSTGVRFAPDDTHGQRQGLIKAMLRGSETATLYLDGAKLDARDDSLAGLTMAQVSQITDEAESEEQQEIDEADKQHIVATSDEFARFIGQNNSQMLDFLTSAWDGTSYSYETTTREVVLDSPLLNIIGCTTPVGLAGSMPPAAAGQGFLSRMILVYGANKYKSIARPIPLPERPRYAVREQLANIYGLMSGEFTETTDAKAYCEGLYSYTLEISDSRFGYYSERRYDHLIKLAMCLAAGRDSQCIVRADYEEAHRILRATERGMPDALGEFGLNPLASLKQSILEHCRGQMAIPVEELRAQFHRDARAHEFTEVLNDLHRSNHIVLTQGRTGTAFVSCKLTKVDTQDVMLKMLSGN